MMLAIARITSIAIAKRIELSNSMTSRATRWRDFDCRPVVVTLIQTPTEQQKRVQGHRTVATPSPFSCFFAGLTCTSAVACLHVRAASQRLHVTDVRGHNMLPSRLDL